MIDRVLIAEDHESSSISIRKTLEDMGVKDADYVYYCDDALAKIVTAKNLEKPYDLLIVDLSFEEDSTKQMIKNGTDLIIAARTTQPDLKVLVFSSEQKASILEDLFSRYEIDGYVRKARHDSKELKTAITYLSDNKKYLPRQITQLFNKKNTYEFSELDITIITLLASGTAQKDIPSHLEQNKFSPSSLSTIEKRLKHIKTTLGFQKNEQLVAFCKDMGII